jgi:hypothetical protein
MRSRGLHLSRVRDPSFVTPPGISLAGTRGSRIFGYLPTLDRPEVAQLPRRAWGGQRLAGDETVRPWWFFWWCSQGST